MLFAGLRWVALGEALPEFLILYLPLGSNWLAPEGAEPDGCPYIVSVFWRLTAKATHFAGTTTPRLAKPSAF